MSKCGLCGEPMPPGEEMFNYHGFSGPCPKPPLPREPTELEQISQLLIDIPGSTALDKVKKLKEWWLRDAAALDRDS